MSVVKAAVKLANSLKKAPVDKVASAAKRAGTSVSALPAAIRRNPITAGLVALELYGFASPEMDEFLDEQPEMRHLVESMMAAEMPQDTGLEGGSVGALQHLGSFQDEFDIVRQACAKFSMRAEDLLILKAALSLDNNILVLYSETKRIGSRLL